MMRLATVLGHEAAHRVVAAAAAAASARDEPLASALRADPQVAGTLDPAVLESLLDPGSYLGLGPAIAADEAGRAQPPGQA